MGRYRRRRKRINKILMLPPVLLAAVFVWLLLSQMGIMRPEGRLLAGPVSGTGKSMEHKEQPEKKDEIIILQEENDADEAGVSLLFAGDIYLSGHVLNAYDKAGGIHGVLDERLRVEIETADIFMANQEFPFSDRGTAADKEYAFRLPESRVSVLQDIGPDIVTLANNHALDYGRDALLDTRRVLSDAGLIYVGAGRDREEAGKLQIIEKKGVKVGFLAATRVMPDYSWAAGAGQPGMLTTYDPKELLEEIKKSRQLCDYLVVYVHWGIEKDTMPQEYQRTLGHQYIDAGADLVVGSHPHVLQGIEYYNGKPIVYSLGNFVFGSSIPQTALLEVRLTDQADGETGLKLHPCTSGAGYTKTMEDAKRPEFFSRMQEISFGVSIDGEGNVVP